MLKLQVECNVEEPAKIFRQDRTTNGPRDWNKRGPDEFARLMKVLRSCIRDPREEIALIAEESRTKKRLEEFNEKVQEEGEEKGYDKWKK
jgi:acyl-CoA reductase-like NAD-dependent aldehyde dehydrogenase